MPYAYLNLLTTYLQPQRGRLLLLGGLISGTIGLQLLNPQILRGFIDSAENSAELSLLLQSAALFLGLSLLTQLIYTATAYVSVDVAWNATNRLRHDLATHLLQLDMRYHNAHTAGELLTLVDDDVKRLSGFFSDFSIRLVANALLLIGIVVMMFRETWLIGTAAMIYVVVTFFVLNRLRKPTTPLWQAERKLNADLYSFLEERLNGIEDIRSSGAVAFTMRQYFAKTRALFWQRYRAYGRNMIFSQSANLFMSLGYVGGLAIGVYSFQRGEITVGTVYLILFYISLFSRPFRQISVQVERFQTAIASLDRVLAAQRQTSHIQDSGTQSLPNESLSLQYKGVSFAYQTGTPILNAISFELKAGQVLGLIGRTGSGKTTLARLLFRLYEPDAGIILLNGIDIRDVPLAQLRQRIGLVTQNVQIFNGTIRENMTFFAEDVTDAQLMRVIEALGLGDWVRGLPNGLDTTLLADGTGISTGEAQLLALTRVFLKDPDLLIMDEASAHLDPATERLLERALDRLLANRTSIIIAHRLQTVQRADQIMILDHGRCLEHGPRTTLLQDPNSRFSHLVKIGLAEVLT